MHTVTFFSYKGGVGRTLLAANMAKYMARIGLKVVLADMDFEAPGLHYKLGPVPGKAMPIERGIMDLLDDFISSGKVPEDIRPYLLDIAPEPQATGVIHFLPAGNAPDGSYFKKLSKVDWKQLFYSEHGHGISFFMELKYLIEETYKPDIFLIDARTGMTDIGGLATAVLADQAVCLFLATPEHLEGTRQVMHGIKGARRMEGTPPVKLLGVLSRIPRQEQEDDKQKSEEELGKQILDFLNEPQGELGERLGLSELSILHREPLLERSEKVLIGSGIPLHESMLLQDYIRLTVKLIPGEEMERSLISLIGDLESRLLDDPDEAEAAMEALAHNCPHPRIYLTLLKMYRVRRAPFEKRWKAVSNYWLMTPDPKDPLLWISIKDLPQMETPFVRLIKAFDSVRASMRPLPILEALWKQHGMQDPSAALSIARMYASGPFYNIDRGIAILQDSIKACQPSAELIFQLISYLYRREEYQKAQHLFDEWKATMAKSLKPAEFMEAWATALLRHPSQSKLKTVLEDPLFSQATLRKVRPDLLARIEYFATKDISAARTFIRETKFGDLSYEEVVQVTALARDIGELDVFKVRLTKWQDDYLKSLEEWPPLQDDDAIEESGPKEAAQNESESPP